MKTVYTILGSLFLALGILGIFLPLLPTTPFMLLAAALYMRSSPRLYGWMMSNQYLGHYITNYRDKHAITLPAKIMSLTLLWGTILFCIIKVIDILWVRILLGAIMIGVTMHILSFRTMPKSEIIRIRKARSRQKIETVAALADEIWHEYYISLISKEQIDYMVDRFQSVDAIAHQINNEGYRYYLIEYNGESVGYMGLVEDGDKIMLSKIYIRKAYRGKGLANEAFTFIENLCLSRRLHTVWLTVNKGNEGSIAVYKKRGFVVADEVVTDIGGGFVMDDYIMEKGVGRHFHDSPAEV